MDNNVEMQSVQADMCKICALKRRKQMGNSFVRNTAKSLKASHWLLKVMLLFSSPPKRTTIGLPILTQIINYCYDMDQVYLH